MRGGCCNDSKISARTGRSPYNIPLSRKTVNTAHSRALPPPYKTLYYHVMNLIIAENLMRLRMARENIIPSADPPNPCKKTTLSNLIYAHTYMNFHPCPLFRLSLEASSLLWKTPASVEGRLYPWAYILVRNIESQIRNSRNC